MATTLSQVLANEYLLSNSVWFHQYLGGKKPSWCMVYSSRFTHQCAKYNKISARTIANASVTFAMVVVRFIWLRFSLRFFGIVGGYKLPRMCLDCLQSPYVSFGDKLGQNLAETLRTSYYNRKVVMHSLCYLHDLPIRIARYPYDDLAEVARSRYSDCAIVV